MTCCCPPWREIPGVWEPDNKGLPANQESRKPKCRRCHSHKGLAMRVATSNAIRNLSVRMPGIPRPTYHSLHIQSPTKSLHTLAAKHRALHSITKLQSDVSRVSSFDNVSCLHPQPCNVLEKPVSTGVSCIAALSLGCQHRIIPTMSEWYSSCLITLQSIGPGNHKPHCRHLSPSVAICRHLSPSPPRAPGVAATSSAAPKTSSGAWPWVCDHEAATKIWFDMDTGQGWNRAPFLCSVTSDVFELRSCYHTSCLLNSSDPHKKESWITTQCINAAECTFQQ